MWLSIDTNVIIHFVAFCFLAMGITGLIVHHAQQHNYRRLEAVFGYGFVVAALLAGCAAFVIFCRALFLA